MNKPLHVLKNKHNSSKLGYFLIAFSFLYVGLSSSLIYNMFPSFFIISLFILIIVTFLFSFMFYLYINPVLSVYKNEICLRRISTIVIKKNDIHMFKIEKKQYDTYLKIYPKKGNKIIVLPSTYFDLDEIEKILKIYIKGTISL